MYGEGYGRGVVGEGVKGEKTEGRKLERKLVGWVSRGGSGGGVEGS